MKPTFLAGVTAAFSLSCIAGGIPVAQTQILAKGGTMASVHVGATPVETPRMAFIVKNSPRSNYSGSLVLKKQTRQSRFSISKAASSNIPEIYGSVVYSDNQAMTTPGIYKLPVGPGESFTLVAEGPNAEYGGAMIGETYYSAYMGGSSFMPIPYLTKWDSSTWTKLSSSASDNSCMATDVAYDATSGKVYGAFANAAGTSLVLGTIDYSMGLVNRIANTSDLWCAMATAPDGTLYGIASDYSGTVTNPTITGSSLYTINKTNGAKTLIGSTGLVPDDRYNTSAIIDPRSGRMFWAFYNDITSGLYEINLTTGVASLIISYPNKEQVTGLFITAPAAEDGAPAECTGISASFPAGTLTGNISFTLPSTLFSGATLSGQVSYKVLHGNDLLASGNGTAGATVTIPLTVQKAGKYEFSVIAYNAVGDGPAARISTFIGHGTPTMPQVTASYADCKFHVEWTPVTEASDGGYLDPSAVTYKVVRYPSNIVVAQSTPLTSLVLDFEEPASITSYYYGVTAIYNGKSSQEGQSNRVTLGSIVPPYTHTFDSESKADNHTIINANNDHRQWVFNSGSMVIQWNKDMAMDDWLITPAVKMRKGYSYKFTVNANIQSESNPERLEVKFGKAPTVESMTGMVIEPTVLTNAGKDNTLPFSGNIVPTEDGVYYIGIHGMSDANRYNLYVTGYSIDAPTAAAGPSAPTDLTLVPDANGAFRITGSVTAPSTDLIGQPLTSLTRLDVLRGDVIIKSIDDPTPGETYTFSDEMAQGGTTTYSAAAYNAFGKGDEISASVLVGINPPAEPQGVRLVETSTPGEVTLSWEAVDRDANGNPLNPGLVTYTIYQLQAETHVVLYDDITGTSHTFQAVKSGEQNFVHFFVSAQTAGGISQVVDSPLIPAGTPYPLPYNEPFPNGDTNTLLAFDDSGTVMWSLLKDGNEYGVPSHSADNGLLISKGRNASDTGLIHTMKILIDENTMKPGASFYVYNMGSDYNNTVELAVFCNNQWKTITSVNTSSFGAETGWHIVSGSLEEYAGKEVLVGIRTIAGSHMETFIDDLYVGTTSGHDLAVTDISAPSEAGYNKEFAISATLLNKGIDEASGFSVVLLADGEPIATETGRPLAPGASDVYTFRHSYSAMDEGSKTFKIKADYSADELLTDNISDEVKVAVKVPALPLVSSLHGYRSENGIELKWETPETEGYEGEIINEDFESYKSFATEFGDWTTFDGDAKPIGKIVDVNLPGIEFQSPQSWWIMDATHPDLNKSYIANSGVKYLAQMYLYDASQCDDWLISPELTGSAQTLSFFARSYDTKYRESFEVMVSYTGNRIEDFNTVGSRSEITANWSSYSFGLPEGAKYFAIRCVSRNKFMLMIDDISFIPAESAKLELKGFNIWKNGLLVTETPIAGNSWLDSNEKSDIDPEYRVTAVYDKGESKPSEIAGITFVSLGTPENNNISIKTSAGTITVCGVEGLPIIVSGADGRTIASINNAAAKETIIAAPGIYLVKAGNRNAKVIVR